MSKRHEKQLEQSLAHIAPCQPTEPPIVLGVAHLLENPLSTARLVFKEGGRVEDVGRAPVAGPAQELLGQESQRDHPELVVEPLGPEPQKQVDAEHHGDGPEGHPPGVPPRPLEQSVETEREQDLGEDQREVGVDALYVPSPPEEDRPLRQHLHPVVALCNPGDGQLPLGACSGGEQDHRP